MKAIFICALAVLLAGCASHPISEPAASNVPQSRLTAPSSMLAPCDGCGELVVTRDLSDNKKLAFDMHLSIDGTEVAEFDGGEKASFWLKPGTHKLSVRLTGQGFGLSNQPSATVTIQPGKAAHYRLGMDYDGGFIKPRTGTD